MGAACARLAVALLAVAATSGTANAAPIDPSDFGPLAMFESFENATPEFGVTQPFPSTPGLLAPPPVYSFPLPGGLLLVRSPDPNDDGTGAPFVSIHDYAQGDPGLYDLGQNGVISDATQVPFGTGFVAIGSEPVAVEFISVGYSMVKMGFWIVASRGPNGQGSGRVTIELIRRSGTVLETHVFDTLDGARWGESFAGFETTKSFASVRITSAPDTYWAMDGFIFETVPEPGAAGLGAAAALLAAAWWSYGRRERPGVIE